MHQDLNTDSDFIRLDFDLTQQDVRKTDKQIVELIRQMFVELRQIREESKIMRQDLHLHIQDEKAVITHAFPNGDADGHRAAHDAWIRKAEAQAKLYEGLKESAAKWGLVGVLGMLASAVWYYFLSKVK